MTLSDLVRLSEREKEVIERFISSRRKRISENTQLSYKSDITQFFSYARGLGIRRLESMAPSDIQEVMNKMGDEHELSGASLARKHSAIKSFVRWAVMNRYLKTDIFVGVERPKTETKIPHYLTLDEISRFMNVIDKDTEKGMRDRTMFELAYGAGMRVSELRNTSEADFDFPQGTVRVYGKGNKERIVPLPEGTINCIKMYVKTMRKKDFLFHNRFGKKIGSRGILKIVKSYAKKAGIEKTIGTHTFRHTYATHLMQNGATIRDIQELLGHKNITTTAVYTHLMIPYLSEKVNQYHPRGGGNTCLEERTKKSSVPVMLTQ